jgi:phage-related minor tail protein
MDNHLWLSEPFTRAQAWIDLLLLANHKDNYIRVRGNRIEVRRGQVGWSQQSLAKRWKWSRKKVANFLSELQKKEQQIEQQKNNVTTLITIINYEQYQIGEQQKEQQKNSRRTAEEQQKNTNKNVKNEENEKNIGGAGEIDGLKELHLQVCGLNSLPPLNLYREILGQGKPVREIEQVYEMHGGDRQPYRQRNVVEELQAIRDGTHRTKASRANDIWTIDLPPLEGA